MAVCRVCTQLIEDNRLICPHCYAPQRPRGPAARRARAFVVVTLLVTLLALLLRLVVHWLL